MGEARLAVGAWVASGAVVVHADRHRAAAMLNRAGLDIDGEWTRRWGKVDPRNSDRHDERSVAQCRYIDLNSVQPRATCTLHIARDRKIGRDRRRVLVVVILWWLLIIKK